MNHCKHFQKILIISTLPLLMVSCKKEPNSKFMSRDLVIYDRMQSMCMPAFSNCSPNHLVDLGINSKDLAQESRREEGVEIEWIKDDTALPNHETWAFHATISDNARGLKHDLRYFIRSVKIKDKEYNFIEEMMFDGKDIKDSMMIYGTLGPIAAKFKKSPSSVSLI